MPNAYKYDTAGFYAGSEPATADPLQPGNWLLPINSTLVTPPETGVHEIARWVDGAWVIAPDYAGVTYWVGTAQGSITERGVPLPEGATLTKPQALIDAEEAERVARTFTFIDNMGSASRVPVLATQQELDRLTLQYTQAKMAGLAAVVAEVSGASYTFTMSGFEDLLGEYSQTLQFFALRGTGVMQAIVAELNAATAVDLKNGKPDLLVLGSKDAKVAAIQLTNHAAAFKVAFPDLSAVPESSIITWIMGKRSTPFVLP